MRLCKPGKGPLAKDNILLGPWPSRSLAARYVANEMNLGIRLTEELPLPFREVDCCEIVPFSYVERLFEQEFWDTEVAQRGRDALRPATIRWADFKAPEEDMKKLKQAYDHRLKAWKETARSNHALGRTQVADEVGEMDGVSYIRFIGHYK